jgi:hypothetical protein
VERAEGVSQYRPGAIVVLRSYHDFDKGNLLRSICCGELGYVIRLSIDLRKPMVEAEKLSRSRLHLLSCQAGRSHQSQHRLSTSLVDHSSEVQSQRLDGLTGI